MTTIVLASNNSGKLRELRKCLWNTGIRLTPQGRLGVQAPAETAGTYEGNALIKARNAAKATGLPALADDSGLMVRALNGAPGVDTAVYAGPDATDEENNRKLLQAMLGVEDRKAELVTTLAYVIDPDDDNPLVVNGWVEGEIAKAPKGKGGFAYDPLFLLPNGKTLAELPWELKRKVGSRGRAVDSFLTETVPVTTPRWVKYAHCRYP